MRFASCRHHGRDFAAMIVDDVAIPLAGVDELGPETLGALPAAAPRRDVAAAIPLAELTLRPLIPRAGKIICVGLNYLAHVGETGREIPEYPVLFTKFAEALVGPSEPIMLPPESAQVDYEGELAVIIGTAGRRIAPADALRHVAGYAIANDVTMRDFQYKTHQWLQGKAWEASTPLGPWLVTPDEAGDPGDLELRLSIGDRVLQEASTAQMMFDVPTLIGHISTFVTLRPGDVILTGTPGGVGFRREPQVFLQPGDTVRVEISGLGALENAVMAEPVSAAAGA
jgi:acylpyruvate hydrolase